MDSWQVLVFFIFPIIPVLFVFFRKRKLLWVSPIISTVLSVVYSILIMPSILTVPERSIFWAISVPLIFGVAISYTVVAYLITWIIKKRFAHKKTKFELLAEKSKGEKINPKIDIDWGHPMGK